METETRIGYLRLAMIMAALLAGSGCAFDIDASVIKSYPDAANPTHDARDAAENVDEDAGDATYPGEGGGESSEGGEQPLNEGGADPPLEPEPCADQGCPVPCADDLACEADEYCSVERGVCEARCSGQVCAKLTADVNNLIADGHSVYWASNSSGEDLLGSPLPDAGIWSWDLQHEPTRLVSGLRRAQLLFIAEGFAYYLRWDEPNLDFMHRSLQRVATAAPGVPEVISERAYSAWKTELFVYWSTQDGGGASELWRRPRGGAGAAERVASAQQQGWIVGNDSVVLRSESRSDDGNENYLVSQQLSDLSVSHDVLGPEFVDYRNYELFLIGSVLYVEYGPSVYRIPLDDPGDRRPVPPPSAEWVNGLAQDGWLYWCAGTALSTAELTYGRTQNDMLVPAQALLQRESPRTEAGVDDSEFAIAGDMLVYWKQVERRLFTLPLPPLPCAEQLPCPDEKRCTPAMLCE